MDAIRKIIFLFLFFILTESLALAKTKFDLVNNVMLQSGHGGKQVHDGSGNQSLTIFEPVLYIDSQVTPHTTIFGSALIDLWTSASEGIFDTNTGASGRAVSTKGAKGVRRAEDGEDNEDEDDDSVSTGGSTSPLQNRIGFNLGVAQKIGKFTLTPRIGYSSEFDYRSLNGGLNLQKSFADDNFVVSLGYQLFLDSTHPYNITSSAFTNWQSKRTQSVDCSVSQILSQSDLILLGYSYTNQSGFLAGSQNSIDLNGTRISEILPSGRNRNSASLRYVHGFTDNIATHLDYRFYFDDWGLKSHTIAPSLLFSFNEEAGLVKFFYRFYQQNAVNYYQDSFTAQNAYMTSDSDLAKFSANEGGALLSYSWELKHALKSISLSGGASYYRRSNDLTGTIFQFGIGGTF